MNRNPTEFYVGDLVIISANSDIDEWITGPIPCDPGLVVEYLGSTWYQVLFASRQMPLMFNDVELLSGVEAEASVAVCI